MKVFVVSKTTISPSYDGDNDTSSIIVCVFDNECSAKKFCVERNNLKNKWAPEFTFNEFDVEQ